MTDAFRVALEFEPDLGLYVARIESGCPRFLIVDADLAGSLITLSSFARSLRPEVKLLAVTCYWSDCDDALRDYADAIVHKPPRRRQWEPALDRLRVPRVEPELTRLPAAS